MPSGRGGVCVCVLSLFGVFRIVCLFGVCVIMFVWLVGVCVFMFGWLVGVSVFMFVWRECLFGVIVYACLVCLIMFV